MFKYPKMSSLSYAKMQDEKKQTLEKKCEWVPCDQEAKYVEASGDGMLVNVCLAHRKLLRKQKQVNNNC